MSSYTLKLDLNDDERNALVTLLRTEVERAERKGTAETPFAVAVAGVLADIDGYESAAGELRIAEQDRRAGVLARLANAASRWEDTVGAHTGAHIDAGCDMRDAARELTDRS